jgi:hypothetical protein
VRVPIAIVLEAVRIPLIRLRESYNGSGDFTISFAYLSHKIFYMNICEKFLTMASDAVEYL